MNELMDLQKEVVGLHHELGKFKHSAPESKKRPINDGYNLWLITVIFGLFFSSKSTEVLFDSSDSLYRGSIQPECDHEFSRLIFGALDKSLA